MKVLFKSSTVFLALAILSSCNFNKGRQTISLAGDSTMAPKKESRRPETGWGEMLFHYIDTSRINISNHARNGRSTRTFISEGKWQALVSQVKQNDYVFIQFGHNDQSEKKVDRYTPPDQFKKNLELFISEVRNRGATPVLFTPVVRRRFDKEGGFYDVHGEYPDLTREVAMSSNTLLVDHHKSSMHMVMKAGAGGSKSMYLWLEPGEFPNYPEGLTDNTHFSHEGARRMAGLAVNELRTLGLDLPFR